jgi:hypothetical protein
MPAEKYIALVNGVLTEVSATVTGGTAAQDGKVPALDSTGRIDQSLMPVGVTPDTYAGTASEALNPINPLVYVKADGTVANASATSGGNPCTGFILSSAAQNAQATVFFEGRITGLTGLTAGARYYLSDVTPGGVTASPVSGTGKLHQYIGRALTSTTITFECDDHVVRA